MFQRLSNQPFPKTVTAVFMFLHHFLSFHNKKTKAAADKTSAAAKQKAVCLRHTTIFFRILFFNNHKLVVFVGLTHRVSSTNPRIKTIRLVIVHKINTCTDKKQKQKINITARIYNIYGFFDIPDYIF
nr:MAG TPA: hypothetical protein [Caudoviricetes sp.]